MSRTVWYTSDTHFLHGNVIEFCDRPWPSLKAMNKGLARAWNKVVKRDDIVYHLGDFSFDGRSYRENLSRFHDLNGEKHLIVGNHDDVNVRRLGWASVQDSLTRVVDGVTIHMSHYPPATLGNGDPSVIWLHGHLHTKGPSTLPVFDVGVDANRYAPVKERRLLAMVAERARGMERLRTLHAAE